MLSLVGYGYAGDDATIVATGANFSMILQLGELLQEQNIQADLFVLSKIVLEGASELISSLRKTKKLIWVIDHDPVMLEPLLREWLGKF